MRYQLFWHAVINDLQTSGLKSLNGKPLVVRRRTSVWPSMNTTVVRPRCRLSRALIMRRNLSRVNSAATTCLLYSDLIGSACSFASAATQGPLVRLRGCGREDPPHLAAP